MFAFPRLDAAELCEDAIDDWNMGDSIGTAAGSTTQVVRIIVWRSGFQASVTAPHNHATC